MVQEEKNNTLYYLGVGILLLIYTTLASQIISVGFNGSFLNKTSDNVSEENYFLKSMLDPNVYMKINGDHIRLAAGSASVYADGGAGNTAKARMNYSNENEVFVNDTGTFINFEKLELNGRSINGTIDRNLFNYSGYNSKFNKSGDTAEYINIYNTNYNTTVNMSGFPGTWSFQSLNAVPTSFLYAAQRTGGSSTQFYGYTGTTKTSFIHRFALRGASGNITTPEQVYKSQTLQFDMQAHNGTNFQTASTRFETVFTQNGSERGSSGAVGANLTFSATPVNGSLTKFLESNGFNVTLPSMTNTGNALLCISANKEIYYGNPGC